MLCDCELQLPTFVIVSAKWKVSIDGKHILIKCLDNAGSCYFNYLKRHSIVLLAIVGPEYEFLCIDVGAYGRNSDGGIFEESEFGKLLNQQQFWLPPDEVLLV